jgi:threonine dehydrogenase-like Zn-dependent dehydrogenase
MKAAVLVAPGRFELREVDPPEPGDGEVLVRLEGCGVCGSNLEIWQGRPWFSYPLPPGAPGHEGWGVVADVGPGVEWPQPGVRVALLSERAFAEFDCAGAGELVPLPGELAGMPFPGEPLACAINVVEDAGIASGDRVAVVGAGFLGLCVTGLAAARGAEVTVINRRRWPLSVAEQLGARHLLGFGEAPAAEFDVAVECTGRQEALDLASELPRQEGTLVLAGFHQDGRRSIDLGAWNWRALRIVNAHHRDRATNLRALREAVDLVARGTFDPAPLFTHRFPLAEAGAALDAMTERPDGFVKALVLAA